MRGPSVSGRAVSGERKQRAAVKMIFIIEGMTDF